MTWWKVMSKSIETLNKNFFAAAVKKLHTAASVQLGNDCISHAELARLALKQLGIDSTLVIGYAAWRVDGKDGGAVVGHHPKTSQAFLNVEAISPNAMIYHVWLEVGDDIVDFTTYQLPDKARRMDEIDNHKTPVSWTPDYLWVNKKTGKTYEEVRDSFDSGVYCYEADESIKETVEGVIEEVDDDDVNNILFIYKQMCNGIDLQVIGVNHAKNIQSNT